MTSTSISPYRSRWARAEDLVHLWRLENASGKEDLWAITDFQRYVLGRDPTRRIIVKVDTSTPERPVVGFLAFYVRNDRQSVYVPNLVVAKALRRKGIGSSLLDLLPSLDPKVPRGHPLKCFIRESDLDSQLFARANGWRCVLTIPEGDRGSFLYPPETAYCFMLSPQNSQDGSNPGDP